MINIEILLNQMYIPADKIKEMANNFRNEIVSGLNGEDSSLMMIPSFIGKPSGKELGTYLAVDMGGTHCNPFVVPPIYTLRLRLTRTIDI